MELADLGTCRDAASRRELMAFWKAGPGSGTAAGGGGGGGTIVDRPAVHHSPMSHLAERWSLGCWRKGTGELDD